MSDSNGYIYDPDGISRKARLGHGPQEHAPRRISEYVKQFPEGNILEGQRPWSVQCDCAFPPPRRMKSTGKTHVP